MAPCPPPSVLTSFPVTGPATCPPSRDRLPARGCRSGPRAPDERQAVRRARSKTPARSPAAPGPPRPRCSGARSVAALDAAAIDRRSIPAQLQRAAEPEELARRRDREATLGGKEGDGRTAGGASVRQAVALGRLIGAAEAERAATSGDPGTGGQDDGVGRGAPGVVVHGGDAVTGRAEPDRLGPVTIRRHRGIRWLRQPLHEDDRARGSASSRQKRAPPTTRQGRSAGSARPRRRPSSISTAHPPPEQPCLLAAVRQPVGRGEDGRRPRPAETAVDPALLVSSPDEVVVERRLSTPRRRSSGHRLPHPGWRARRPKRQSRRASSRLARGLMSRGSRDSAST